MQLPRNIAPLAIGAAVVVAGAITGLAAEHVAVPQILDYAEATLLAGAFGLAVPTPPA